MLKSLYDRLKDYFRSAVYKVEPKLCFVCVMTQLFVIKIIEKYVYVDRMFDDQTILREYLLAILRRRVSLEITLLK